MSRTRPSVLTGLSAQWREVESEGVGPEGAGLEDAGSVLMSLLWLQIESGTMWKQVYVDLGIPVLNSAASYNVKTAYKK